MLSITNVNNHKCNCRSKPSCPLNGECLTQCLIYRAISTTSKNSFVYYVTSNGGFKTLYAQSKWNYKGNKITIWKLIFLWVEFCSKFMKQQWQSIPSDHKWSTWLALVFSKILFNNWNRSVHSLIWFFKNQIGLLWKQRQSTNDSIG